jgi:hypothetical protein
MASMFAILSVSQIPDARISSVLSIIHSTRTQCRVFHVLFIFTGTPPVSLKDSSLSRISAHTEFVFSALTLSDAGAVKGNTFRWDIMKSRTQKQ